jgi:recombination protein RecR
VVENIPDLWAIEQTGIYKGHYHVLHGLLAPLDGVGPDDLNIDLLEKSVRHKNTTEIIVATRPSVEGEATALLIKQTFARLPVKITRIASGIPHGSEIEYTDSKTLEQAIDGRREI